MSNDAAIDEIIGLLDAYAPVELDELRALYPDDRQSLEPTIILGDSGIPLPLAVDACLRSMQTVRDLCVQLSKPMVKKLNQANRLQSVGKIISVVSSASLIALLATKYQAVKYSASVLALLGNLLPEIAAIVSSALHPEEKDLFEFHKKLSTLQSQASLIYDELVLCKRAGYTDNSISGPTWELVKQGNILSYNIQDLLRRQGVIIEMNVQ